MWLTEPNKYWKKIPLLLLWHSIIATHELSRIFTHTKIPNKYCKVILFSDFHNDYSLWNSYTC